MTLPYRKRPALKSKSKRSPHTGSPKKTGHARKPIAPRKYIVINPKNELFRSGKFPIPPGFVPSVIQEGLF